MATAAASYLNALLALFGNAQLTDARTNLLTSISDPELEQVAKHAMASVLAIRLGNYPLDGTRHHREREEQEQEQ